MKPADRDHIALCKRLIEEKFHFENGSLALRQRDLEYLADQIEERSGIKLSLSTLKRLWKKDYDQTPHPSTLDALVSVLDCRDWQEFKLKYLAVQAEPVVSQAKKGRFVFNPWMVLPMLAALAVVFWLIAFRTRQPGITKPIVKGPVSFSGNKTVTQGVPNTIIFSYDVSNVEADSFFFQQSWNERERVKLDPEAHHYSTIYYYPGFHRAKLIANDSILKIFRAHITTDGWMPLVRYAEGESMPIYIKKKNPLVDGALHVTRKDVIASNVNVDKEFLLSYFNVREFDNTHSDSFSLDTRVICDSSNTIACPGFELVIMTEAHIFFVRLAGNGCERYNGVKMGEVMHDGVSNDLSAFGCDLYQWQDLRIEVVNKQATIYRNKQPIYKMGFKNDFGKIVGLSYRFLGTGAIDYVRLQNGGGKVVYEDEFFPF